MRQTNVVRRAFAACVTTLCLAAPVGAAAQTTAEGGIVETLLGRWTGSGVYDGNELNLTRRWTLELRDQFVRADMRVQMPNGSSFGALMYWQPVDAGIYDVQWMDGVGRNQKLRVSARPDSRAYSTIYLDLFAEAGPEWREWEFEAMDPGRYVERLYRIRPDGRELLTEFSFERIEG